MLHRSQLCDFEVETVLARFDLAQAQTQERRTRKAAARSPAGHHPVAAATTHSHDEDCPICLAPVVEGESTIPCQQCENVLHLHCMTIWVHGRRAVGLHPECPLCRSRWQRHPVAAALPAPPSSLPGSGAEELLSAPAIVAVAAAAATAWQPPVALLPTSARTAAGLAPDADGVAACAWADRLSKAVPADVLAQLLAPSWRTRQAGLAAFGATISASPAILSSHGNCVQQALLHALRDPVVAVLQATLELLYGLPADQLPSHTEGLLPTAFNLQPALELIVLRCHEASSRTP
jgi:hypothetical protein